MKKIYKCFVSSTYADLKDERRKVFECILDMHHLPVGMENFNAANESQWQYITRMLNDCDYFILIVAHRYGSVARDGISYTEKEANYARKNGIPVLAFIISPDVTNWPHSRYEKDKDNESKLESFKNNFKNDNLIKYWNNKDDLATKVVNALSDAIKSYPRPGYIRGDGTHYGLSDTPPNKVHTLREPKFRIDFCGQDKIEIDSSSLSKVDAEKPIARVQSLTPGVPPGLEKFVSERDIDNWNYRVPQINQEIDIYNEEVEKYNAQLINFNLPFSVINTGTARANNISVKMIFPEWVILHDKKITVKIPVKPNFTENPVKKALNEKKRISLADPFNTIRSAASALTMPVEIPASPISISDLISSKVMNYAIEIIDERTVIYHAKTLQHSSNLVYNNLFASFNSKNMSGIVNVTCHCDELAYPQNFRIPIRIF